MGIRILFGIYSDLSPSRYICGLAKIHVILYFSFGIYVYVDYIQRIIRENPDEELNIPITITVYEFIVPACWNFYHKNEKLFKFNSVVQSVDSILRWESREGNVKVALCMTLTIISLKTASQYLIFGMMGFESFVNLVGFFMTISHFVAILPMVMILELFYARLKHIRIYLSECEKQITEQHKMLIVKKFLYVYKSLMNIVQHLTMEISFLVSIKAHRYIFFHRI